MVRGAFPENADDGVRHVVDANRAADDGAVAAEAVLPEPVGEDDDPVVAARHNELERLALWAGDEGTVRAADLEAMIADTSETAVWALSDALLERDAARAVAVAERLVAQGENVTGLVYGLASRLRKARLAAAQIEEGVPPKQIEAGLGMHPYAARQLVARVGKTSREALERATATLADLEVWCRGGAEYGDELALTLALRRASAAA